MGIETVTKIDAAIVGAGPAGLTAAYEIKKAGGHAAVFDENAKAGGQLFKQIHKFFGSSEHGAGIRGIDIGCRLLDDCRNEGVEIYLNAAVYGIFPENILGVTIDGKTTFVQADKILIASGATEKALAFEGWDKPGVMGAGAFQTMMNVNYVLPGKKVVMIGSGNVGLVVAYQILQAGGKVVSVVEAAPSVSGYAVHADKLKRHGVRILTSHSVKRAIGSEYIEKVEIAEVDSSFSFINGTEQILDADTVCIAVGLTPSVELLKMAGARMTFLPRMGGYIPLHGQYMQTTVPGLYVAGDAAGIEEASSAMEEGRLAGICIAHAMGLMDKKESERRIEEVKERLSQLRSGHGGHIRTTANQEIIRRYGEWNRAEKRR